MIPPTPPPRATTAPGKEAAAERPAPSADRPLATALSLRAKALETVRATLGTDDRAPYALLDFPCGENVGDSAIWLGTRALLAEIGLPEPAYTCDDRTFEPDVLEERVGDGPILLLGGGNFGDLFGKHQRLREGVVARFPGNRIVQLPQSIHFAAPESRDAARRAFAGHRRLTVLTRDAASLATAQDDLGLDAALCPDLALGLGALPAARRGRGRIRWLTRLDAWRINFPPSQARDVDTADWPGEGFSFRRQRVRCLSSFLRHGWLRRLPLRDWLSGAYDPLAKRRLDRAMATLRGVAVVVSDRLHGAVLSMLADVPVVLLDDATGKVRAFHDAWFAGAPGVRWATSAQEALALARETVERAGRADGGRA